MKVRQSQIWSARFAMPSIIIFIAGTALLTVSLYFDGPSFLRLVGFPADRLYHPRVLGDLAIVRLIGGLVATMLMTSQVIFWKYPSAGRTFYTKVEALMLWQKLRHGTSGFSNIGILEDRVAAWFVFCGLYSYEGDDFAAC